jgi:hypothetical protein
VWADLIALSPPLFNINRCLLQSVEDFTIEQLVTEFAVEAHKVSQFLYLIYIIELVSLKTTFGDRYPAGFP